MYGFPDDFDPGIFVGRQFSLVTFGENFVGLKFEQPVLGIVTRVLDDDLYVTVTASVSYRPRYRSDMVTDSPPFTQTELVSLLGRYVVLANLPTRRKLVLALDEGGPVVFADDSDFYESFTIRGGGREVFI
jgi:hypothetical protein